MFKKKTTENVTQYRSTLASCEKISVVLVLSGLLSLFSFSFLFYDFQLFWLQIVWLLTVPLYLHAVGRHHSCTWAAKCCMLQSRVIMSNRYSAHSLTLKIWSTLCSFEQIPVDHPSGRFTVKICQPVNRNVSNLLHKTRVFHLCAQFNLLYFCLQAVSISTLTALYKPDGVKVSSNRQDGSLHLGWSVTQIGQI